MQTHANCNLRISI